MRVYLDTGLFVDYLALLGPQYSLLRTVSRRGRNINQLSTDAAELFQKINRSHSGATSCLTFYEGEEALYGALKRTLSSRPRDKKWFISAARGYTLQIQILIERFGFEIRDLTAAIIEVQLQQSELETQGIRAADALHFATAIGFDADVLVTTDKGVLALDKLISNLSGKPIRCVDSDGALAML